MDLFLQETTADAGRRFRAQGLAAEAGGYRGRPGGRSFAPVEDMGSG